MTPPYAWHVSSIWAIHRCDTTFLRWGLVSHVSHTNKSCLTHKWVMSLIWMGHISHKHHSFICVKLPLSCKNEPCLMYRWVMSRHFFFLDRMSHVYQWHDSFICVTCLCHVRMSHVLCIDESCLGFFSWYEWVMSPIDTTHSYVCGTAPLTRGRVVSCSWESHVTRMDESCLTN